MNRPVLERVGLVCRWKPVHRGHAALLESLCEKAGHVLVGLGSPNVRDARNPFTAEESARMIELVLRPRFSNFELVLVPDLGDGPRWAKLVQELFGPLDLFVSENAWVRELMAPVYRLAHPAELVPRERHTPIDGTLVRRVMALGADWRGLVPPAVADYLDREGLVARFRREFGLECLAGALTARGPRAIA
jgi:nicotinamide-nucleotide adenylyltransferase